VAATSSVRSLQPFLRHVQPLGQIRVGVGQVQGAGWRTRRPLTSERDQLVYVLAEVDHLT